jgi:hypothetical protein
MVLYHMTQTYTLTEQDYLAFELYTISKTPRFQPRQRNGRSFVAFCSAITMIYFIYSHNYWNAIYFGIMTVALFIWYPRYFKWRQKVHYLKHIRRNYKNKFGLQETLVIDNKLITITNHTGTGTLKPSNFDKICETSTHYFMVLESGAALILPKKDLNNQAFKSDLKTLKLPHHSDFTWRW